MRVLITGRGSIAQRHARLLRELAPQTELGLVSSSVEVDPSFWPCRVFSCVEEGVAWIPDAVIVASVSSRHADELVVFLRERLPVLAEKPLVVSRGQLEEVRVAWEAAGSCRNMVVGCQLRYLPSLRRAARELKSGRLGKVVRAQFEVGQDLRQWRPSRDIKTSYSAQSGLGGGVVFDLVHEIDMANWLLGPLSVNAAIGGHLGSLPITSDDVHVALLRTAWNAPVTVSLDYVSRQLVRRYSIVAENGTLVWDMPSRQLAIVDESGVQSLDVDPSDFEMRSAYLAQMRDWLTLLSNPQHMVESSLEEAFISTGLMLDMKEAAQ